MKKLLVFVGGGGSGKTTLIAKLVEEYPDRFKKVVTCTSRPMRVGEVDGADYHFLPTEYFSGNQDLVLVKKTSTGFYYGTRKSDLLSDDYHLLLTLRVTGIKKLVDLGLKNIAVARISISEELKVKRMRQRGDTEEMIASRLQSDVESKVEVDFGQLPIINLDATQTIRDEINLVMRYLGY